jgi:hypothetical protein
MAWVVQTKETSSSEREKPGSRATASAANARAPDKLLVITAHEFGIAGLGYAGGCVPPSAEATRSARDLLGRLALEIEPPVLRRDHTSMPSPCALQTSVKVFERNMPSFRSAI